MKSISAQNDGIIFGKEHDSPLFIRKVTFDAGYKEDTNHRHPNSFEYYYVVSGRLTFQSGDITNLVQTGEIMFFDTDEPHRIVSVDEKAELLLFKRIGVTKIQE